MFSITRPGFFAYGNVGDLEEWEISGFLDKFLFYYILHLKFDIPPKMNRITSNEDKTAELSVSRGLLWLSDLFEIQANKMLEGTINFYIWLCV